MIIKDTYKQLVKSRPTYTNEEFLVQQIWLLKHVYCREISAIKNCKLEYIAFTNQFASAFNLDSDFLGKPARYLASMDKKIYNKIEMQELDIITHRNSLDTVRNFADEGINCSYIMRKRPLINPTTNEVVGIMVFAIEFDIMIARKFFTTYMLHKSKPLQQAYDVSLTPQQHFVITCLLLGFNQRKEIAFLLNNTTENNYSETQIKKILHKLYQQFNCSTSNELITLISTVDQASLTIKQESLLDDSWPIRLG